MRTTILVVAVVALATSPLTACSRPGAPPSVTTATATTTPANTSRSTGASFTMADLDAALLTLSDLPAGYTRNTEAGPDYSVMSGCSDEAIALDGYHKDAQAKTGTAFSTTSGRLVVQSVTLLSGETENNTLAALKKAVARCSTWDIDTNTYTMSKANYGPYGEESLSYRVSVDSEIPIVLDVVFFRRANLLVGVLVATPSSANRKDAQTVFDNATRKPAFR